MAKTLWALCIAPLALGAAVLPIAWYVVVPFFIDADSMDYHYAFVPMSTGAYTKWGTAMLVILPFLFMWVPMGLCTLDDNKHAGRWVLYISAVPYVILLVVGHLLGAAQTSERQHSKALFATKFNDVYCSARTFQACVQGNEHDILTLVGRTTTTITNSNNATSVLLNAENVTTAAFSIWQRCIDAQAENTKRVLSTRAEDERYSNAPIYRLLDDCDSSRDIDAWCGHYQLQNATLSTAEHLALPSPFASNPHMFAKYTGEWARRMKYTDALLGSAIGCMMLTAWSVKAYEASDGGR